MTAIELSHRQWLEQGALLASEKKFLQSEVAARGRAPSHEPTIALRHYEEGRLGYSLTQHPAAQFERSKTSGGSPPLQRRDVLRSNGSMFFCTEADGSGLPHAEAKLASFKKKYEQLSLERAFPDKYAVRETRIQERVKTALKEIVHVEESKRNGQREEHVELMQVCSHTTQPPAAAHWLSLPLTYQPQNTLVISCGPQRVMMEVSCTRCSALVSVVDLALLSLTQRPSPGQADCVLGQR